MEDWDLADRALTALQKVFRSGVDIRYAPLPHPHDAGTDGRLTVAIDGRALELDVVVTNDLNSARAARLVARAAPGTVVVSRRVTPTVGKVLREGGIGYLDLGGNAHIEAPPLLLHVSGMESPAVKETARAFNGEGLKVIFLLLLDATLASAPYRRLSEVSGASHGVVQYTMGDLVRLKYVDRLGRTERRLRDVGTLLDRWAAGYTEVLRPKRVEGTFAFAPGQRSVAEWRDLDLAPGVDLWGGEPAAALDTGHLRPARLTIYTRAALASLMKRLRVAPSDDGVVTVVRPFWSDAVEAEVPQVFDGVTVPRVVTYADLVATDDPRNAEVASLLRDQILSGQSGG